MNWKEELRAPDLTSETFTRVMSEAAREQLDADVRVAGPLVLHVNAGERVAFQCNLQGLWEKDVESRAPDERQQPCEDYLRALGEHMEEQRRSERGTTPAAPAASDLLPIIQSRAFVRQASEQYEEAGLDAHLCADPLVADLCTVYVLDRPRSLSFVSSQHLGPMGMTQGEMAERARRNLREAFAETELAVLTLEHEGVTTYRLSSEGLFASSLPLVRGVAEQLEARVEGTLLAVVAARDELFVAGEGAGRRDVAMLALMGEKYCREDRYPVSERLVAWRGDGWDAYEIT